MRLAGWLGVEQGWSRLWPGAWPDPHNPACLCRVSPGVPGHNADKGRGAPQLVLQCMC